MAIKFKIQEIGKSGDPSAPKKFHAKHVHTGEVSLEELVAEISHASSINESDVYTVLQSLVREIPCNISSVRLLFPTGKSIGTVLDGLTFKKAQA